MARPELIQTIALLSRKIDTLLKQLEGLKARISELEITNSDLQKRHQEDQKLLQQAKKNIEFLSLSHRLAATPEALLSARKNIADMIKTIDSCLSLINED